MKHLAENWKVRSAWILGISLVVTALLWTLSLTDWAEAMNQVAGRGHGAGGPRGPGGERPSEWVMGLMSLVKVVVLTVVPAVICYWIVRLAEGIKGWLHSRHHHA